MITEIELKYSLLECRDMTTDQQVKAQISHLLLAGNIDFVHQEKKLINHYFDTKDLLLRQKKIALRTRTTQGEGGNPHFEQTIKTSGTVIAGLHQRPEYNVDIADDKPLLALFPCDIWQEDTDLKQLQSEIIELFSTNFIRHTWLITLADAQVELAFDSGEIACQGSQHQPKIYEIELELVTGNTEALFVLTKLLFTQLALRPGQLTKAARGYALYNESQLVAKQAASKAKKANVSAQQASLPMIPLPKSYGLNSAFTHGVEFSLTQLQHSVDSYVEAPSLHKLNKISQLLVLLRQGFWLFDDLLTAEEKILRSELSYFIRTIHWVDNALYVKALLNKQSSYQKAVPINQDLITKLQLSRNRYPNESQVLALLHSERFNNLQLALLSLLLKRNSEQPADEQHSLSLVEFATKQLTDSIKLLRHELTQLQKPQVISSTELYLTAHSLLIRALLTTSWFSRLFCEQESNAVSRFILPLRDIKQGISELQCLSVLQQQLVQLPQVEKKLALWLASKSDNLITALDQSRAKALTIKPYWP